MDNDWENYKKYTWNDAETGLSLDLSKVSEIADFLKDGEPLFDKGLKELKEIEAGEKINTDEDRMVGHYWLRAPELAPSTDITQVIQGELSHIKSFEKQAKEFKYVLQVGIGGSALGPQLLADAFRSHNAQDNFSRRKFWSLDNTDPDGAWTVLHEIPDLSKTIVFIVSKSGGTKETRNGMVLVEKAFSEKGLNFSKHAVAVTGEGSKLYNHAKDNNWLEIFPMWDWVGGRTSIWSTVGLLPAAFLGIDIDSFLAGAKKADEFGRATKLSDNPQAMLGLVWFKLASSKDMVVLPYKDRLLLLSRYLQQLVMESLGKEYDRSGKTVEQGLAVYGNKGSTDQHAYVQQLRDGINNFFALFIEVQRDLSSEVKGEYDSEVEEGVTAGDYLHGFYLGTREALSEKKRSSISLTINELSPYTLGMLIALFEKAVGFFAAYADINAYHQPGVEAGKKAAGEVLELQKRIFLELKKQEKPLTVDEIANAIGSDEMVHIYKILERQVSMNEISKIEEESSFDGRYHYSR